jgi:heptose I phosphotransferase
MRAGDELTRKRALLAHVAAIARRMHAAGLHHQDFYLNHFLYCGDPADLDIRVIDLGRVQQRPQLSHRWILKDLAQLDFSARRLSCRDRLRFLRLYLDRPFRPADRWLIRQIMLKSRYIATHTAKNNL